jgi:predicted nucleic acid-binding protein
MAELLKPKVYIETSFVSYLVARRSRDLIVAARQQLTIDWWENQHDKFELFISETVLQEARQGDAGEIAKRLKALDGLTLLDVTNEALRLANELIKNGTLPAKAAVDAVHIAVATVHKMDYLLTWNCKHIANGQVRKLAGRFFRNAGYEPSVICTPEELGENL